MLDMCTICVERVYNRCQRGLQYMLQRCNRWRRRNVERGRERQQAPLALGDQRSGLYRGTSLIRNYPSLGPCRRPLRRVLGGGLGGWVFLMSEVPRYGQ